ncbi:hypothetical protein BVC80_1667g64 [Macleaya cordata]|uniref:Uncharacterized protein n=1 Tax=Macleaya cordata TaxID=56857 RepID=A0A200RBE6_MACCD|nr:hypothetical protein BVC80_1667g64 [Macleaya cordata]
MSNTGEKKPLKMEKLIKYSKKLKKMVTFPRKSTSSINSPTRAVHCDELYLKSVKKCKNGQRNDNTNNDPVLAAYILAQNHFSLRPNFLM